MTEPASLRCAAHPDVETNLRCGKCGKPICPRCLVQTPVGARCRDCARVSRLPTYRLTPLFYLRAVGATLGMAVVIGIAWGFFNAFLHAFFYVNILIAGAIGWAIGEVTGLAVNRKRGVGLAVIGGAAVVLCYLVNAFTFGGLPDIGLNLALDIVGIVIGIAAAVSRLR